MRVERDRGPAARFSAVVTGFLTAVLVLVSAIIWKVSMLMTLPLSVGPDMSVGLGLAESGPSVPYALLGAEVAVAATMGALLARLPIMSRVATLFAIGSGPVILWAVSVLLSVGPLIGLTTVESGIGFWLTVRDFGGFLTQTLVLLLPAAVAIAVFIVGRHRRSRGI